MYQEFGFGKEIATLLKTSSAKDKAREVLCGTFYLDKSGGEIHLVSTDTYRLAIVKVREDCADRWLGKAKTGIYRIEKITPTGCLACKVAGKYPNWRRVVPAKGCEEVLGTYGPRGYLRMPGGAFLDVNLLPQYDPSYDVWRIFQQKENRPYLFETADIQYILMPIARSA